ncbi:hypothetical protein LINPERHAP1_LOCUS18302 [Linum perenne]
MLRYVLSLKRLLLFQSLSRLLPSVALGCRLGLNIVICLMFVLSAAVLVMIVL